MQLLKSNIHASAEVDCSGSLQATFPSCICAWSITKCHSHSWLLIHEKEFPHVLHIHYMYVHMYKPVSCGRS